MTSEQAKFLLDNALKSLKRETATTAKVLAATPEDRLDYRPSEGCMPAGELVDHIAISDLMFLDGIVNGSFGKGREKPESVTTPKQLSAWYAEEVGAAMEKLSAFTPEDAARILDFHGMMQFPAGDMLTLALHHSIHHRGQLAAYLRPMGAKVPAIYGPSGDENPFAKAEAV